MYNVNYFNLNYLTDDVCSLSYFTDATQKNLLGAFAPNSDRLDPSHRHHCDAKRIWRSSAGTGYKLNLFLCNFLKDAAIMNLTNVCVGK